MLGAFTTVLRNRPIKHETAWLRVFCAVTVISLILAVLVRVGVL